MNLIEATINALQGKLNEVYVKEYVGSFDELLNKSWGGAKEILEHIQELGLEKQCMDWLEDMGTEDRPVDITELNDYIVHHTEDLYDGLGLDINGNKIQEARNPENDEINNKISKTLNGSTKYMDDLDNAGLGVKVNDKGKADSIYNKAEDENNKNAKQPNEYVNVRTMNKQDLKNSNTDTDYYNYLTKNKVRPEVTDTGAFAPTNVIRNSNNFEKTISGSDTIYRQEDRNGVSKAIPKRYKTGRKNYDYNPDVFPRKDYTGVASYEPLDNQELQDFKYNKSKVSDGGWLKQDLDKAKAEYDKAKADYDKVNNQVQDVRSRIAKSKANRKEEARSHKEDNERVAPRDIDKLDVSLGNVGNFAPKNSTGNKYTGTTEAEYRSKRNRTGRKNDDGVDEYITYNNHYDTAVPTYQDFKWNADEFEKEANKYRDNTRGQYATKMMISHQKEADKVVDRVREKIANKKTESAEDTDTKNIQAIQDVLKKSGITSERTLDLMSKDILNDLKKNYTKGCKDEYGNYYGTVITDAFRKKVQQITGKMPDLKIGESKKVENEMLADADRYPEELVDEYKNGIKSHKIKKSQSFIEWVQFAYPDVYNEIEFGLDESKGIKEEKLGRNRKIRKKVESLNAPVDGQAYWAYVLGYDFLQDYFKNSDEPECDLTFEKAWEIADDFMHSEEFQDTSKSGYDALVDYLKNNKLI